MKRFLTALCLIALFLTPSVANADHEGTDLSQPTCQTAEVWESQLKEYDYHLALLMNPLSEQIDHVRFYMNLDVQAYMVFTVVKSTNGQYVWCINFETGSGAFEALKIYD